MRCLILIPLMFALIPFLAAQTVQTGNGVNSTEVISSTATETVVQFNVGEYEKTKVEIEGEDWFQVSLRKEGKLLEAGFPELPVFNRSIIIDDQALMKLEVYDLEYEDIELPIAPSKGRFAREIDPATVPITFDAMYDRNEFYPARVATLSEPYILRDFRGVVVQTVPFAYNPVTRTLRTYTSYKVRVYADGMDTVNVLTRTRDAISREFIGIYQNNFLNWDDSRDISDFFGKMLVIYHDAFEAAIYPYLEWKNKKGIYTESVPFSEVGTTAFDLYTYIVSRYYNDTSIAYIQLVGDEAQIPTQIHGGGGADPMFSLILGSDDYPDIFVGRFSAATAAEVTTQVNKVITYERDFTTAQTWLQWATGVASENGPYEDGEYDWQHMDNIRSDLLFYGYTTVDQIYPNQGNNFAFNVSYSINRGSGLLNYCGGGSTYNFSTTGFDTGDVNALTNGVKTPVICSVASYNGNFVSYTCLAESFLRKSGGGAIAFYGSSNLQDHNPPMSAQDEIVDLLVIESNKTVGGLFFNGSIKMLNDYPTSGNVFKTWNIFGDASLLVRTKNPIAMTVSHNDVINVGETTSIAVSTGVPFAYVGITVGTTIHARGYANNLGNFTTSLTPATFQEYDITVTAHNRVTYRGKIYAGYIWNGSQSTVWSNGANWNVGTQPFYTKDVLIPSASTRYPVTSQSAGYARNIVIESDAEVTVGAYDLVIFGTADIWGLIIMNQNTDFEIMGDVLWKPGSYAEISSNEAEIYCKGNMYFYPNSNVQLENGTLEFWGTSSNCYLYNTSYNTEIHNLRSNMGDGLALVYDSSYDLVINGSLLNYTGSSTYFDSNSDLYIKGLYLRDYNSSTAYGIKLNNGHLHMDGATQYIDLQGPGCYLNNLIISSTGTVYLLNDLTLNGHLSIQSGVFHPGGWGIELGGNWINLVGPDTFNEATSTVTFNGSGDQYCNYSETFNTLIVASGGSLVINSPTAEVTCASYDWVSGGIEVINATFTANDLVDDGIFGSFFVEPGATINLTNNDGYVDINGDLVFAGGGTINVYGGTDYSYWPYESPGSLSMSGGTLDFKDQSIWVNNGYNFSTNISGGTIRTVGNFQVFRNDFNPTGGTIELVGSADCVVNHDAGSSFYNLIINKSAGRGKTNEVPYQTNREGRTRRITRFNTVSADSDLDVNGDFSLAAGTLNLNSQEMNCAGNVNINGTMTVDDGAVLRMGSDKHLEVNDSGRLEVIGTSAAPAMISRTSGYYYFNVNSGGTIAASYGIFEYVNNNGIWIKPGAIVDPDHSLNNCTFRLGYPGGRLLLINNNQSFTVTGAVFPANTWGGAYNVSKTVNSGSVYFDQWSGDFGGPNYEQDSYGRIDWEFMGLPMIEDLSISYVPASDQIRLDWTYPIPDTQFKIYRSSLPEGPFSFVGATTDEFWTQDVPGPFYFYRVTAVMP